MQYFIICANLFNRVISVRISPFETEKKGTTAGLRL